MIKVYRYGLLEPTEGLDRVREQMLLAARYRNTLVEIERGRRNAVRALLSEHGDVRPLEESFVRAEEALRTVLHDAKAERVKTESRVNSPEIKASVKIARDATVLARQMLAQVRRQVKVLSADALAQIDERAADLRRNARAYCGVYWSTYQLIEDQDMASRKQPLYDGYEPKDPRFQRFTREGQVSVQIIKGMRVDELTDDTQVRVEDVVDRSGRDRFRMLWLRVGSDKKRGPIWAKFPMQMHREIPKGSRIKRVTVDLTRRGPKREWVALFTIELPEGHVVEPCGEGAVAIDIGWRIKKDDSVRVAKSYDGAGAGEFALDERTRSGFQKTDDLQQIRDKLFVTALTSVKEARELSGAPQWFRIDTQHAHQWRSEAKLVALVGRWGKRRFDGDEGVYLRLSEWSKRDHHLWHYESGQRINTLRRRRERYRIFAAEMARKYGTLVIEDFDLREVAKTPPIGRDTHQAEIARHTRHIAATSELRLCLVNAFLSRGGEVVKVDPSETTMTCNECGLVEVFDAAKKIDHTCANGHVWDQDDNAAINIFERWRDGENGGGARMDVTQQNDEGRWRRAKRMRAEKEAKKGGARKADDKAAE